jgi:hypothetical protein
LVRKATLLGAAGVLMASAAFAGVPSAANSTAPGGVPLVTRDAGTVPDNLNFGTQSPTLTIVVRDLANNLLNNASVVIDLSGTTDLAFCGDQQDVNATINCGAKTIRKFTDVTGTVTFHVLGGGKGAVPASGLNAGKIFANGTLIKSPTVPTCDLNGINGIDPFDQAILLGDINAAATPRGRSDENGDGIINAFDKAVWLTHFNQPTHVTSCASLGTCP